MEKFDEQCQEALQKHEVVIRTVFRATYELLFVPALVESSSHTRICPTLRSDKDRTSVQSEDVQSDSVV